MLLRPAGATKRAHQTTFGSSSGRTARSVHRMLHGLAAYEQNNGEILLFEEGSWINRVFMYRIPPHGGR